MTYKNNHLGSLVIWLSYKGSEYEKLSYRAEKGALWMTSRSTFQKPEEQMEVFYALAPIKLRSF
jgi:hypothetical protein